MSNLVEPTLRLSDAEDNTAEYHTVDLFKFMSCVLVIMIHTKPFESNFWLDAGIGMITRFAVPYFLAASSFFLFLKLQKTEPAQKNKVFLGYIFRLVRFYAIWFVIQNMVAILRGDEYSILYYVKQFILPSNGSPLWFLAALIFAAFLVYMMTKSMKSKLILVIALACFAFGYCYSTLAVAFSNNVLFQAINHRIISIIGTQNGLFFAFPYVAMGLLLSQQALNPKVKRDIICVVVFFCLLGLESLTAVQIFHAKLTYLWISVLPMTYFAMRLTLTVNLNGQFHLLRKMSTLIYVLHPVIMLYIKEALQISVFGIADSYNLIYFAITFFLSGLLAILIIKLSGYKQMRFLKLIY